MRKFIPRRPSAAMIVAITALFVALGGTGYAAFRLPKSSVGSKQLKNGAVKTKKIKNGAVTAAKINTSGLTVPNALLASSATSATNASHANAADAATNATHAITADTANGLGTLASGKTETGVFAGRGTEAFQDIPISFPLPLASAPTAQVVPLGGTTSGCTGSPRDPTAAPGTVCVYEETNTTGTPGETVNPVTPGVGNASRFGLFVFLNGTAGSDNVDYGAWAVTAP